MKFGKYIDPFGLGIGKGIDSFLNPDEPYKDAQQQLQNYYNQAQNTLNPYNQNAQNTYGGLSDAFQNLMNPQDLYNKWSQSYTESPLAQIAESNAQQHGLNAASSMGLMGSSPALAAIQQGTSQIGLQDKQNYLQDLMNKYQAGIGLGQNIYGVGANAAGQSAQQAMNMGGDMGNLAYGQSAAPGKMFGDMLNLGIGAAVGGPLGMSMMKNMQGSGGSSWSTSGSR